MIGMQGAIEVHKKRLQRILVDVGTLTDAQLAAVLLTYRMVFARSFTKWMCAVWNGLGQSEARAIVQANLLCEVGQEHPLMLRRLVSPLISGDNPSPAELATGKTYSELIHTIFEIDTVCETMPIAGLVVLTFLENLSQVFIPWLKQAADRLGLEDQEYLAVHGEADVDHATEFCRAVPLAWENNAPPHEGYFLNGQQANQVMYLLTRIFTAYRNDQYASLSLAG